MTKPNRQRAYPSIGAVSSGTMRTEDLIDVFAYELSYHMKRMRLTWAQRKRFRSTLSDARICANVLASERDHDQETAENVVQDLFEALDEIAPPYAYFGASEGDGACYGFWPRSDIEEDDEMPKFKAGDNYRGAWGEDVLVVNDHGNLVCGHVDRRGRLNVYWAVV